MLDKHKIIEMYTKGFAQKDIAQIVGVSQSTISRLVKNPTKKEVEDFYENHAYGVYITEGGDRYVFNRRYKPLVDKTLWVKNIVAMEWFYNDATPWNIRLINSANQKVVYENKKS